MATRRSIRLDGYDYTGMGGYFVTVCTHNQGCLFGQVVGDEMVLNPCGAMVRKEWLASGSNRSNVILDPEELVVMPNHLHGIVWLVGDRAIVAQSASTGRQAGVARRGVARGSLGAIIRAFKSAVTRRVNQGRDTPSMPVWQRNYHEHIIRDAKGLEKIREYIRTNPLRWSLDRYHRPSQGEV